MKLSSIVALLALASVIDAHAQAPMVDRIEIVERGIYGAEVTKVEQAPGTAMGTQNTVANLKLISSTSTVSAQIGTRFGLRYRIVGSPNQAKVKLTIITRFPGKGLRNPKTGEQNSRDVALWDRNIGSVSYNGYRLDQDWELVPGTWTFEVWYEGRKLAEQSFTVVK